MLDAKDFYSDLDSNSGKLLKSLHELLNNLDLSKYKLGNGGGGPNGPDWHSLYYHNVDDIDEKPLSNKMYKSFFHRHILDIGENPRTYSDKTFNYNSAENNDISSKIDLHNNLLEYPRPKKLIYEKNILLNRNVNIERFSSIYEMIDISNGYGIKGFLHSLHYGTYNAIKHYNILVTTKLYNESLFKFILPSEFKQISDGLFYVQSNTEKIHAISRFNSDKYLYNFLNKKSVNHELYDNILIAGLDILCIDYVFTKLMSYYSSNLVEGINSIDFYIKGWEFYQESLQKYYPFFDHYNWNCKLFQLDHI
jgi:hypothetical protein